MLNEQVRAAGDLQLQRLLARIRQGVQDLNNTCFREGRRIPWESVITAVTPLNRNRWSLNTVGIRGGSTILMILSYGDYSSIPIPAVFMFVPGMLVIVTQNTHQELKLVNGAAYTALDGVLDKGARALCTTRV
ncbi:hypothetical protein CC80DRAFT_510157 [Byssothecium circinans]|uniref:Uncharacterized protein n=1 Tax=Byssothecium circinans TaxID=147558 RepID=A0A6A5TE79_9PLEO|nr:hypothetical protein CC80DRAFT_510157 [Byssothecium circinans]